MHKLTLLIPLTMAISACGGGGGGESSDAIMPDPAPLLPTELPGIPTPPESSPPFNSAWSLCSPLGDNSRAFVYKFSDKRYEYESQEFLGEDCQGQVVERVAFNAGTFNLGELTSIDGLAVYPFNVTVDSLFGTTLGANSQYSVFELLYVEGDAIYLGEGAGFIEADRPISVDLDKPFVYAGVVDSLDEPTPAVTLPPQTDTPSTIEGVWLKTCSAINVEFPEDGYDVVRITVNGNSITSNIENYEDASCTQPLSFSPSVVISGRYTIGNTLTTAANIEATEIDTIVSSDNSVVDDGEAYDIFYIDGNNLYFGEETNDNSTPANRPQVLDFTAVFVRQ